MPTYEYACTACGIRFERRQAITEAPLAECPECGGAIRRLMSGGSGFILKGGDRGQAAGGVRGCSLEQEGRTCYGREERCGAPQCEGEK
jgi:putative FmdB family regulatory protein